MWQAIFSREVSSVFGSRWAPALILAPLLLLSGLVVARWPAKGETDVAGARARDLFALIGYTTLGCVLILTPTYPATSIVRERRGGTLALLFRTPVTGPGIYAGKFLAALACVMLPVVMSAPAVAACYAMGGIDLMTDVVPYYAVLVLTIVQYVAASLWVSRFASTSSAAVRTAYGMVVVLAVLVLGPSLLAPADSSGHFTAIASWLRCLSPIPPLMDILGNGLDRGAAPTWPSMVVRFGLLATLSAVIFAIHTAATLTPTMFDRTRAAGTMTQDRGLAARSSRRLMFLIDPQRRTAAMPGWINPVLVKEFRSRRFGRGHWMVRLVVACALISLALTYVATTGSIAWSPEAIGAIMVLLQTALIVLFTPSLASSMISEERETGAWSLLCMTPLSTSQIVLGKLMSVAWTVSLVLLATLPGYAVMILVKPVLFHQVRDVLWTLVLIAAFAICVSGAASAFFHRTTTATLAAYSVLVAVLAAPMVVWLGRDAPFGHQTVERALAFSPLAAALSLLEAPGFTSYQLLPTAWWALGGGIAICIALLGWRIRQLTQPR